MLIDIIYFKIDYLELTIVNGIVRRVILVNKIDILVYFLEQTHLIVMVCVGVGVIIITTIISGPMRVMSSYIISLFVRETASSRQIIIRPLIKLVYYRLFDEHFERVFEFLIAKAVDQKITRTIQIDQHNRRVIADQLDLKCSN